MIVQIFQDTTLVQVNDTIRTIAITPHETFAESLSHPGSIIAISAIVVSITGLIISLWYNRRTLNITIEHNKKSVEPILNTDYVSSYKTKIESLKISNRGLGPAIIKKIIFLYKGDKFDNIIDLYKKYHPDNLLKFQDQNWKYGKYSENTTLAPNEDILLYEIKYNSTDHFEDLRKISHEIITEITYWTIYKEKRIIDE